MKVTWIIPDTYGFLVDELEVLASSLQGIRVLSGMPVANDVRDRIPNVDWHHCPEQPLLPAMFRCPPLRELVATHGALGILSNGRQIRKIAGIYQVLSRLEREAPSSLIHSHFAHPGGLGGTLLRETPQLLTLRGYDILTTGCYGALWNPFYRKNLRDAYSNGPTVTAGSSHSFQRARQILGPDADLRLLPQGIIPDSFIGAGIHNRESLGLQHDSVVLLSVGNLVGIKNHCMLLDALPTVATRISRPIHLLICGDGPLEGALRTKAKKLALDHCVHFMGRLHRSELTDLYRLGDLLVHTSLSEGFGNIILEAMLAGLLVVASPVGVAPDVIHHQENGFLPMLGDKDSLISSLVEAIGVLPSMHGKLLENRKRILQRFHMDRRIDGYLNIYHEIVGRKQIKK